MARRIVPQGRRRGREHERVRRARRPAVRAVRLGRRRRAGRRDRCTARRVDPARARSVRRRRRGTPAAWAHPESPAGRAFHELAARIVDELLPPVEMAGCTARIFELATANLAAVDAARARPVVAAQHPVASADRVAGAAFRRSSCSSASPRSASGSPSSWTCCFRRRMQDKTRTEAGRTAAIMLGVLANIYAVLIAFVIVQGWSNLQQAQTYVDAQATALTEIRENSKVLGPADARRRSTPSLDALRALGAGTTTSRRWRSTGTAARSRPQQLEAAVRDRAVGHPRGRRRRSRSTTRRVDRLDNIVVGAPIRGHRVGRHPARAALPPARARRDRRRRARVRARQQAPAIARDHRLLDRGRDRVHAGDRRELRPPVHRQHRGERPADPQVPRRVASVRDGVGALALRRASRPTSRRGPRPCPRPAA